ncbi:MAG: Na+/H+ antiporter NhaA [Thermoanaerobaculia bacterium]
MIEEVVTPLQQFMRTEAASGVILGVATLLALIAANTPLRTGYENFLHLHLMVGVGGFVIDKGLLHWINDGLMAIFFLLVGLEIKREVLFGQLSSIRSALLPAVAAVFGAVVPAAIFFFLNRGAEALRGWAIPMATDIAFALGIVALLGTRIPSWARVFLMALAVVDDLIAVAVIAVFYTESLNFVALGVAGAVVVVLIGLNVARVHAVPAYLVCGVVLWVAVLESGIHATIAGVFLGFLVPTFVRKVQLKRHEAESDELEVVEGPWPVEPMPEQPEEWQVRMQLVEAWIVDHASPLHRLEHRLHPVVAWLIMPLFAFANAGVAIDPHSLGSLGSPLSLGIILGLFFGKQIGIFGSAVLLMKMGLTNLAWNGRTLACLHGVSLIAGIGFTMSLFVAGLAFGEGDTLEQSKIAILVASVAAGAIGYGALRRLSPES